MDLVMAVLSVRKPTSLSFWISVFLLLIFIQMSPVLFGRVFIHSNETLISPSSFCLILQHGELSCDRNPVNEANSVININILTTVVTLGLYIPVVLVGFAWLAVLFAAYAKDRGTLRCSLACQASSSLLILIGIIAFLLLNRSYVSWEHMTLWFYICVGVQIQLVFVTALTRVTERRLTSDWE